MLAAPKTRSLKLSSKAADDCRRRMYCVKTISFHLQKNALPSIPGMPPSLLHPPKGDAFASRNAYALEIDFEEEPPMFRVTDSHYAATWLLDERAPKVVTPIGGNTDGT